MPNYRVTDKSNLKTILETIVFENDPLLVTSYYSTSALRYPYVFITSGDLTPNIGDGSLYEMGAGISYKRGYDYRINTVFQVEEADGITEGRIDELEALITDKLQSVAVRDYGTWLDLVITSITSPYQEDITLTDGNVLKTFVIQVRRVESFI